MSYHPVSATSGIIWLVNSSVASSDFGNGVRYTPVRHAQSDYLDWQFTAAVTKTLKFRISYSMSAASGNNVRLRMDSLTVSDGAAPTTAATTGTAFTVTPGNDVNKHTLTPADSSDLSLAVTIGQEVYLKFSRLGSDGADSHTGDMRVISVWGL